MVIVQFTSILEEALLGEKGVWRLTGNVTDMSRFLSEEAMSALERAHDGYFAFLAFHPSIDTVVDDYLFQDSLPADSGRQALVLFTTEMVGVSIRAFSDKALRMIEVVEHDELPAQAALRHLFDGAPPVMPGLAVFSSFSTETDVLYYSLAGVADADGMRAALRTIFEASNTAWQDCDGRRDEFADALALANLRRHIRFTRTGRRSMREWLVQTLQWISRHRGDIVAVAGLVIGA